MTGYLHRLADARRAGVLPADAQVPIDIQHGPGCRRRPCTCHPRIVALIGDELVVIGSGGAVLERRRRG
ncbi:hypothetical protein ACI2IY_05745 [Lysobacter enzymogenes]|uniref:hypothetical protein n=1 Tax=Lysobacter enzymogenes TaxID=69 RepID=UPI0038514F6D